MEVRNDITITCAGGVRAHLIELEQHGTYVGLLDGGPTHAINEMLLEHAALYGGRIPTHVIRPPERLIETRYVPPHGSIMSMPSRQCRGRFDSGGYRLNIVWFGELGSTHRSGHPRGTADARLHGHRLRRGGLMVTAPTVPTTQAAAESALIAPDPTPIDYPAVSAHPSAPTPGAFNVRIHRGAHEIGGNCVELEYLGSRIVLDVGKPLWAGWDEVVPLPAVPGLADGSDPSLAGVIISHPHLDHYGLIDQVDSRVPIYIGREASLLLAEAEFFSAAGVTLHPTGFLEDRVPIRVGAFTVTPYLADHSGFDSYSLLVEAGGKRLFYTGDIRGHGRKARLFEELLADPPKDIDVLLCEGTHVKDAASVNAASELVRTESDVENTLVQCMSETEGAVAVISSAQNIDRLVTAYRACKRADRILVTDLYTACIAQAIGRTTIPQPGFQGYRVYVPSRQRTLVKTRGQFERTQILRDIRVFPEWLARHGDEITLLQPASALSELLTGGVLANGVVVWSMWPGYLKRPGVRRITRSLESARMPLVLDHSSGHASVADLQRLILALNPAAVVPIHTEAPERYPEIFGAVRTRVDGEWWDA